MIAPPQVEEHAGILVVRDDLVQGGTKRRVIGQFLTGADEFVYASPAYGYGQVALAYSCAYAGQRATVFVAKRAGCIREPAKPSKQARGLSRYPTAT